MSLRKCFLGSLGAFFVGLIGSGADASPVVVDVPSTAAIWLANQPNGTSYVGDTVPQNSPVEIVLTDFSGATELSFHVSGQTSRSGSQLAQFPLVGADGECCGTGILASSLVGIFVDLDVPMPSPSSLSTYSHTTQSFAELFPSIGEIFFIGDGLTGRETGDLQRFSIPVGSDSLFLATFDAINRDNVGSLNVEVVPEPNTALLLGIGLSALAVRREKR